MAIDFTVDPAVIDFGTVNLGAYVQMSVMVTNASDSAPFESLYATQPQQGPFSAASERAPAGRRCTPAIHSRCSRPP